MSNTALLERPVTAPVRVVSPADAAADLPSVRSPRGFALYVGIDEIKAASAGVSLPVLAVALAPQSAGGRDLDVVRLALHEPGAIARANAAVEEEKDEESGVVVDISRKRVLLDGESASFTYKEFELLQYLVLREGRTIERSELVSALWQASSDEEAPGERTIDVHVRRLRAKLGRHEDIVRTVRGVGYRFDRHADVSIRYGHGTPSPDRF